MNSGSRKHAVFPRHLAIIAHAALHQANSSVLHVVIVAHIWSCPQGAPGLITGAPARAFEGLNFEGSIRDAIRIDSMDNKKKVKLVIKGPYVIQEQPSNMLS